MKIFPPGFPKAAMITIGITPGPPVTGGDQSDTGGIRGAHPDPNDPPPVEDINLMILRSQDDCNVVFIVGPDQTEVKCHGIFLKARSPIFKIHFSDRWSPGSTALTEIRLPHYSPEVVTQFLEFIYANKFRPKDVAETMELQLLGNLYEVLPLVRKCEDFMAKKFKNLADNMKDIYQTALKHAPSFDERIDYVEQFVARNISVLGNPIVLSIEESMLTRILSRNELPVAEIQLFRMIWKWAKIQKKCNPELEAEEECEILRNLIPLVRFPIMSLEELTEEVVPSGLLPEDQLQELTTYFASEAEATENQRDNQLQFSKEPRGMERIVELYKPEGDNRKKSGKTSTIRLSKSQPQSDLLRFLFEYEGPFPSRNLMLRGLIVCGPSTFTTSFQTREPAESHVTILIDYRDDTHSPRMTTPICRLSAKLQSGITQKLDFPPIELIHGRQYVITASCNSYTSFTRFAEEETLISSDPSIRASVKTSFREINRIGCCKLSNINLSARAYYHPRALNGVLRPGERVTPNNLLVVRGLVLY